MEQKPEYQLATQTAAPIMPLPSEGQWAMIERIAGVIGPANNMSAPKMANIILWGTHLGLTIPASIELIQNISGKTSLAPRGAWALVQNSPVVAETKLTRLTDAKGAFVGYECYIRRVNGFEFTGRWTLDDAKRAGLLKADSGWEKYPENMCMWRAIGFCADVVAPDVTGGLTTYLKMPEAFDIDVNNEGDFVRVETVSTPVIGESMATITLNNLVDAYGADKVMAANGGMIPGTQEEIDLIAAVLEEEGEK